MTPPSRPNSFCRSRSVRTTDATSGRWAVTASSPASGRPACTDTSTRPRAIDRPTLSFASASSGESRRGRCTETSRKRWLTLRTVTAARSGSLSRLAEP